ncbi:PASTA domain-containing protein [Cellulomonas cellasea]|uniref:Beta-lactam-binding protein with PASTA domain n=1 Tax=Cellulomonas cellasea TaxID=43670 RepID=A0A7W4UDC2_9CELL|nr:PASTA domain-containing protein [Cellulomonas cellasea]MBB2921468.1 beta-lactam-binding protein with PASTA domain [Cellulomonas cellasea]
MELLKPWHGQAYVMRLEPSRRFSTILGVVLVGLSLGGLLWLRGQRESASATTSGGRMAPDTLSFFTWGATAFLVLGFVTALVNGRRWLLMRRIVTMSTSRDGRALRPRTEWTVEGARAQRVPRLSIENGWTGRDAPVERRLRRVTGTSNVTGGRPMRMAYLRLFDNQPRSRTFLQGAWREFGYVYMLRSASSVSPGELRELRRYGIDKLFVSSRSELRSELTLENQAPQLTRFRVFRHLAPTVVRTYDRYGAFPPVAVLCHGSFWRAAVDELLLRVDAVCLDLSGFRPKHQGTGYELQRVIDRFPIERVLFLADPTSNLTFLSHVLDSAWQQMAADSPNATGDARTTHLAITDRLQTTVTRNASGQEIRRETRLLARRKQTRRIAAGLQSVLSSAPPVRREPWGTPASAPSPDDESRTSGGVPRSSPIGWVAALALTGATALGLATAAPGLAVGAYGSVEADLPSGDPSSGVSSAADVVTVPDVLGDDVHSATQRLQELGFEASVTPVPYDAPLGVVIYQWPTAGTTADRGTGVQLEVSAGPESPSHGGTTEVPSLIGVDIEVAETLLSQRELRSYVVPTDSPEPAGMVLDCVPGEGEPVVQGTTVQLAVASGRNTIPDVLLRTLEDAETLMNEAGFAVELTMLETDEAEAGLVVHQSEPAGASAKLGSIVALTVAVPPIMDVPPMESPALDPSAASTITPTP